MRVPATQAGHAYYKYFSSTIFSFAMQTLRYGITLIVSAALTLASCSQDDMVSTPDAKGRQICFDSGVTPFTRSAATEAAPADSFSLVADCADAPKLHCTTETVPMDAAVSRASTVTTGEQISRIGVIAHASWYAPLLMNNDCYTRNSYGVYQSPDIRYWIDDASATVDFYAFAPYSPSGMTFPTSKDDKQVEYTVPTESENQQDVMLAVSKGIKGNHNKAVDLSFKHLLAGVRIKFLSIPDNWTIKSVALEGVYNSGSLDFTADSPTWTPSGTTTTATSSKSDKTETLFMLLPQTGGATLTIVVNDGTSDKTYTKDLGAFNWVMGNITTYSITITNYSFEIEESPLLDAHYVLYQTNITANNIPADISWTVDFSSTDNADITVQRTDDINSYAKQGFWTDKLIDGNTETSARGESSLTLTGSGTFPVSIFIPENINDDNRVINMAITPEGKKTPEKEHTITQLCPAWTSSGFGWEQIDGNETDDFGFKWDRIAYYGYVYTASLVGGSTYRDYCQSVIDQNNAGSYASVETYDYGWARRRFCIKIDYSKLNNLTGIADSRNDGLTNTRNLYSKAGAATTNSFEEAVKSILKTENGHTTEPAFRLGNGQVNEAPAPTGNNINGSPAVGHCIKKNKFNLLKTTSATDVSVTPIIYESDINWYLPAIDQFSDIPTNIQSPIAAGDCWSSTAVLNASDAYLGNGTVSSRLSSHKVRAARNR